MTLSLFFSLTIFLKVFLYVYHLFVRDREERLAALTAAQQEAMEELQKKIQLKVKEKIYKNKKDTSVEKYIKQYRNPLE